MLSLIFIQIFNMSYAASFIIIAVLLIRLLLKRTPKVFSYMLWAVVLFRLLCPISFESAVSVIPNTRIVTPKVVGQSTLRIESGITAVDTRVNDYFTNAHVNGGSPAQGAMHQTVNVVAVIWLVGIALLLLYSAVLLLRLRRRLIGAVRLRNNIYLADHIASPFVIGLFRPKIYLPSHLPEQEQRYIILHEQYHVRRLDHIVKILAFLTLCVYWFNPLVWLAFVLSGRDMEMSCDEAVMKRMDGDIRADYAASLLRLATGKKIIAGTPLAFGEGDTKQRIKNIMNYKKPAVWILISAIIVCAVTAVCLLSNPKSGPANSANSIPTASAPAPSAPVPSETATPIGETKRFIYQNFEFELTNVQSQRTETMTDDGGHPWTYTVITYYPGALFTVINADMSDPVYTADGKAHPQWGILMTPDVTERLHDSMPPLKIQSETEGVYSLESSLFIFKFEAYSE